MKIGLIGFNQTGKTSLFELLTGKNSIELAGGGKGASNVGTCFIPDERIDFLSDIFKPKKTTYAKIDITDVPGFAPSVDGNNSAAARFLNDVRPCDAIIHVLRAFESDSVMHNSDSIDPAKDLEAIESEMLFADLEMIEKRIGRINSSKKITKENLAEIALLERCFSHLENGGAIRDMELSEEELLAVRGFSFLTEKPRLVVVNLDENQWADNKSYPGKEALISILSESDNDSKSTQDPSNSQLSILNSQLIELCVMMELEISKLPIEDRQLFIEDLGITEPGISVLAKAAYGIMNLISFLTYGSDEVRAWTIEDGTIAKVAAGKIHSDIERGFIRAEVIKYSDIFELGSIAKVKDKGLFKLEGKEYVVSDGDLITFRFNV